MALVVAEGLTKHYGRGIGIDGLDLGLEKGAVCGFLGPNGAGKSTTLRLLMGSCAARQDTFVPADCLLPLLGNLYCLSMAVGGIGYSLSALSDSRGRAIGWALAVILASFLLNFLAQFWEATHRVSFLSLMTYCRPADILRGERSPLADMGVLLAVGAVTWVAGAVIFRHRDIRTV